MYIIVFGNTSLRGVGEPNSPIMSKYLQKADEDEKGKSETWRMLTQQDKHCYA